MRVSSEFDGGNIEVLDYGEEGEVSLAIRPDHQSEFLQWFYFRVSGARGVRCRLKITNAGNSAYPGGFEGYRVVYSYDRQHWLRHDTTLTGDVLTIEFTPEHDAVYLAYFAPYSMERHHDLIARAVSSPGVRHLRLGATLDGQDMDLLQLEPAAHHTEVKNCWFISRQHPGETMAEWWMEGLLDTLLDTASPLTRALRRQCRFYLVPNMNPDGSRRGHLRTNAVGANLNREWASPSMERSPEVFLVKKAMSRFGVDLLLDVHGDETLPYNFIAGTEGLAEWNENKQSQLDFFRNTLARLNPDFQTRHGYPPKKPGEANMTMSTAQTAHLHNCLAMTLEMPFKDAADTPDRDYGWSPGRSKALARSCLETLDRYLQSGLMT
ncbi:MAG: M14-type cytosolic carboxypeptidase [Pseudohongiellaceae bacterium]